MKAGREEVTLVLTAGAAVGEVPERSDRRFVVDVKESADGKPDGDFVGNRGSVREVGDVERHLYLICRCRKRIGVIDLDRQVTGVAEFLRVGHDLIGYV